MYNSWNFGQSKALSPKGNSDSDSETETTKSQKPINLRISAAANKRFEPDHKQRIE